MTRRELVTFLVALGVVAYVGWRDAGQRPLPPAFDLARRGVERVGSAGSDPARLDEAVADLQEALKQDPKNPVALFGMGWATQLRGRPTEAEQYYRQYMVRSDELSAYAHHNLSLILEARGEWGEALEHAAIAAAHPAFASTGATRVAKLRQAVAGAP